MKTSQTLFALVFTKNNYRNLNGSSLEIVEFLGNYITLKFYAEEFDKYIEVQFSFSDIKSISTIQIL
jgi:hypothetical protein